MNSLLAEYFKEQIDGLDWVSDSGGLVRVVTTRKTSPDGKIIINRFPVGCDISNEDCQGSPDLLKMYVPDSSKRSIIYFEDQGTSVLMDGVKPEYESKLRMVCWMNLKKFSNAACALDFYAISTLMDIIRPARPVNYMNLIQGIRVTNISVAPKSPAIFSPYTYSEYMQYLLYPYDYFAIDITCKYSVNQSCLPELIIAENDC